MPGTETLPASDCTVTVTAPGFGQEAFTMAGDATFTKETATRIRLDDIDGSKFGWLFGRGMIEITVGTDKSLDVLRNLQSGLVVLSYPGNKRLITLNGATQFGDAITEGTNKTGVTNAISIGFDVSTDTNE